MSDRPEPSARDLIKEQAEEIARLRAELERAERDRDRLQRENERLRKELDAARRAGFRQAAPFSKGAPVPRPRPTGAQARTKVWTPRTARRPPVIDETFDVPAPGTCPDCGAAVADTHVTVQYQEDLPPIRPRVRRFDIHVGRCRGCGRRVQGRHPLQTSDALGAAAVQIGPDAVAMSAVLNKQLGLSFGKIATLFADRFGLHVAPSAIVRALHRAADKALPTYVALVQTVRDSPMGVPDETGWRVRAHLWWLWVFVTPTTTVYAILPGRGFEEAASLLGASYAGVLVHDGWAPYRRFTEAARQTCVNHLRERCRELCTDYPRARLPGQVHEVLQHALAVRDRHAAGDISTHGVAVARGHLAHRLSAILEQGTTVVDIARFMRHLDRQWDALFTFLFDTSIDATTWRAEQALRGAVITRKVCGGGNRTTRGAVTQQVLASVLRTTRQRGLDTHTVLTPLLCAPTPIASPVLQLN